VGESVSLRRCNLEESSPRNLGTEEWQHELKRRTTCAGLTGKQRSSPRGSCSPMVVTQSDAPDSDAVRPRVTRRMLAGELATTGRMRL
jgi:hypothetical protein